MVAAHRNGHAVPGFHRATQRVWIFWQFLTQAVVQTLCHQCTVPCSYVVTVSLLCHWLCSPLPSTSLLVHPSYRQTPCCAQARAETGQKITSGPPYPPGICTSDSK